MDKPPNILGKLENKAERMRNAAFKVKPQPKTSFGGQCISFHRRMIAASIDTLIISFTILPMSYFVTNGLVGELNMDTSSLMRELHQTLDPVERATAINHFLQSEGRIHYFYVNTWTQLIAMFVYCMVSWRNFGATPGKWLVRAKVVDAETGEYLTYIQSFWRCAGYMLSIIPCCLGIFWISWDKMRQGWHDKLSNAVVVNINKQEADTEAEEKG